MKNLNIKHLLATITLGAVLLSCSDQLEQINPNALTNESFWTNVADLNSGLNATYAALRDDDVLGILWEYTRTDIAVPFSMRVRSIGNPIYDQTFDLSTNNVQNKWDACFRGVFRANQVIDAYRRLESTLTNDDSREAGRLVFAQARALRGYFYYVLHHSFNDGSLPLFSSVPVEVDDFQQAFSTSDSVASFFRADLEYGVENLPATYNAWQQEVGNGNLGRVTGGFCEALLAKSYMNENDFATAKGYLENVMINYNYDLVDDLAEVFTGMAEFNRESIFEINFSSETNVLGDDEKNLSHEISDKLNDGNFTQYASWLIMAYRKERADPLKEANLVDRPIYDSSGELDSMQMGVLRYYSLRMANSMSSVDDRDQLMYGVSSANYGTHVDAATHARQYPNFVKKFTHWNVDNGGAGENEAVEAQRRSGVNIPVIRLAEIYLLYAEVMLEEGNLSEALRFINRVRERSHLILLGEASFGEFSGFATYANDIDLDPSNGLEAVTITNLMDHLRFVEKPLELSFEGDRTIDLRRWGVWKQRLEYIAQFEYDTWHYKNNAQEKNPIRWNCFIMPNGELPGYDDPNLPNYAFRQAKNTAEEHFINPNMRQSQPHLKDHLLGSQNFNASSHSYLPIPQDEVFSNLNLSLSGN